MVKTYGLKDMFGEYLIELLHAGNLLNVLISSSSQLIVFCIWFQFGYSRLLVSKFRDAFCMLE